MVKMCGWGLKHVVGKGGIMDGPTVHLGFEIGSCPGP